MRSASSLSKLIKNVLAEITERVPARLRAFFGHIWQALKITVQLYNEIDGEQRAASFAYYVLFSLFPFVALLLTVCSLFVSSDDVKSTITSFLPLGPQQQQPFWDAVNNLEVARSSIGAISVVILLWSSLRFFLGLVRAVNRAWHTTEIPWWQLPLKNLLMITIVSSALLVALLTPPLLQGLREGLVATEHFVALHFPLFDLHLASTILDVLRYIIGGAVLFYAFAMLYLLAPRRTVRFHQVWLPALLVTLTLQACQVAFVSYLPRFLNYGIYGVVGSLMLLLLWVYISGIIIILGGCLCAAADKVWNEAVTPANSED